MKSYNEREVWSSVVNASSNCKRVAVLFSRLSGYTSACLRALKDNHGIELLVYSWPVSTEAPFDEKSFDWIDVHRIKDGQTAREIYHDVMKFGSQAVFLGAGWMDTEYLRASRLLKKSGILIVGASDNQWTGRSRQQLGRLFTKAYLHSSMDVLWVPGDRQRFHARKLGFSGENCWTGLYSCEWESFAGAFQNREYADEQQTFLFAGRYARVKGLDVLVEANRIYRKTVDNAWPIVCAGAGPEQSLLESEDGIIDIGFVQPEALPELMRKSSAFVLPSRKEPWGVVVQEAAASGLPLICSEACGAVTHLVQDGYNGYVVEPENPVHLAGALGRLSEASVKERRLMSERSFELSKQFTPSRWAKTFLDGVVELSERKIPVDSQSVTCK